MNVLIANNKTEKFKHLSELLHQIDKNIQIIGNPSSVKDTLHYFQERPQDIDLAFFETQLTDGPTFDIFSLATINNPVIFTSGSKKDAFEAIKVDGVDYLLEPLTYNDVVLALQKVNKISLGRQENIKNDPKEDKSYKKRFIIKFGDKIQYKNIEDISYIFAEGKHVYIIAKSNGRKYIIEHTLDVLEKYHLNPDTFFRINRKFIVNIEVIEEVRNYVNSRLKLILNPSSEMDMIVSREKVQDFKEWLNL